MHWLLTHSPHGRCRASRAASQAKTQKIAEDLELRELEATGGTCAWQFSWPRGRVPQLRDPSTDWVSGDEKYGLGPNPYVRPRVRPAAARVPAKPPFRRKRDDLFYGPLVWKPLMHEECYREEMRRTDIFGSDGSDTE